MNKFSKSVIILFILEIVLVICTVVLGILYLQGNISLKVVFVSMTVTTIVAFINLFMVWINYKKNKVKYVKI